MQQQKRNVLDARKLVVLVAALSLFVTACRTSTTIDTAGIAPADESQVSEDEPTNGDDDSAEDSMPEPTATPEPPAEEPTATPSVDGETDDAGAGDTADEDPQDDSGVADTTTGDTDDSAAAGDTDGADDTDDDSDSATASAEAMAPSDISIDDLTEEQAAALRAVTEADDWCQAAAAVDEGTSVLETANFNDPVTLEQSFTQALIVAGAAQALAPPEIAGDVATSVEGFGVLAAALEDVGWSFIDLELNVLDELSASVQLATYNIEKYNFEVCGIGTDPGEPPTPEELAPPASGDIDLDGTIRDQAVQGLVEAGFTAEQASCLLDELDIDDPQAFQDTTAILNVFTECGISLDQLGQLGG